MLILDNVAFHKPYEVKQKIESYGYKIMYLPPNSPFLNPTENMFAHWKQITKRANPNNETELMHTIETGATLITSADCENYYKHMWTYLPLSLNGERIDT